MVGALRIRDGDWTNATIVLLVDGAVLAVIGLIAWFGLGIAVPAPQSMVLLGLTIAGTGGWMAYCPRETVIDAFQRTVTLRSPIGERRYSFGDLLQIEIHAHFLPALSQPVPITVDVYDLVMCFREGTRHAVHIGLSRSTARLESAHMVQLTGAPVVGGSQLT